jgi:hypothetical protein
MQPHVLLAPDIEAGRLMPVLQYFVPAPLPVHLLYPRDRQQLPKLRTFIDFMVARFGKSLQVHPNPKFDLGNTSVGRNPKTPRPRSKRV